MGDEKERASQLAISRQSEILEEEKRKLEAEKKKVAKMQVQQQQYVLKVENLQKQIRSGVGKKSLKPVRDDPMRDRRKELLRSVSNQGSHRSREEIKADIQQNRERRK